MKPFYFGAPHRKLFGVFHAPEGDKAAPSGVVLVPPFGHEALRVHRLYRLLAERLARQGVAALRFDLSGSGDSAGDDEDADLQRWTADLGLAHRELLRRIGSDRRITWFGVRLGASVALRAAPSAFPQVHRLVLWDPVLDGRAYLAQLGTAHVQQLEQGYCLPDGAWRRAVKRDPLALSSECLGYAIPEPLRQQILDLKPSAPAAAPNCAITAIASAMDTQTSRWCDALGAAHPETAPRFVPFEHSLVWTSDPFANNELAPASALQKILGELQ